MHLLIEMEGEFQGVAAGVQGFVKLHGVDVVRGGGTLDELIDKIEDWKVISAHKFREKFVNGGARSCGKRS